MDRAIFDAVADSRANMKGDVFKDGRGVLLVVENLLDNLNEGATFVGRFQVVKAEPKGDLELAPFAPGKPHLPLDPPRPAPCNAIGSQVGWPQKIQKFKSAAGNVKGYLLSLLGFKEAEVTKAAFAATLAEMVSAAQPAAGMLVGYETYRQETRGGANAGRINSYVRFTHIPPGSNPDDEGSNHPVQVAKRRAALGLPPLGK